MSFSPDHFKQAWELIFSLKIKKPSHPHLIFNNNKVIQTPYQKHLGMFLDDKLNFGEHLKYIANKVNKSIGLLRKLQNLLPRRSLVTIYKSFIRPHIDYGDVIFDQAYNKSFHEKLENFQYNASLAITGAIRGTSKEKLYQELGFESLQHRRWFRKLCTFYKIFKNQSPRYLYELLPIKTTPHNTRSSINLPLFHIRHNFFKNSFFPSAVIEWNNLDLSIRNSESLSIFKKCILKFIRPSPSSTHNCFNTKGIKYLTRLRLGLSHLHEHKFKHGFLDSLNPIRNGGLDIEITCHFLLHCPNFINERTLLLNDISRIKKDTLPSCETAFVKLLSYGDDSFDSATNTLILNASLEYSSSSKRFDGPLLYNFFNIIFVNLLYS